MGTPARLTRHVDVVLLQELLVESNGRRNFPLILHLQQLCAEIKEVVSLRRVALPSLLAKLLTAAIKVPQDLLVAARVLFSTGLLTPAGLCHATLFSHLILDVPLSPGMSENVPDRFGALQINLEQLGGLSDGDMLVLTQEIDQQGPLVIADF